MISKSTIYDRLNISSDRLATFCKEYQILELSLFGSILREDFRANSDIDLLAVFEPKARSQMSLLDLVDIEHQLQQLSGRQIDLLEKQSVEGSHNWIRRENILTTALIIYESR